MKKNLLRLASLALALCAMLSCAACSGRNGPDPDASRQPGSDFIPMEGAKVTFLTDGKAPDRAADRLTDEYLTSAADLAVMLLRESGKTDASGSVLISPLSISTALAMTANGARGNTLTQMKNVLWGDMSIAELNNQLYAHYCSMKSTPAARFSAANSVWVTNDPVFEVSSDFLRTIEDSYLADVAACDFADPKTVDTINGWCSDKTDGMIPAVLGPDDVDASTVMALINALCFDAKWAVPMAGGSYERTFHGVSGNKEVKWMTSEENRYIHGKDVTGFIKPYEGGNYAFAALLPDEGVKLDDFVASLDGKTFLSLVNGAKYEQINIGMPVFSCDFSLEMSELLASLGMTDAFDPARSDFSLLGRCKDGANVYIGKVIHKTHIDVDTEGTKAAAVTAIILPMATSAPINEPKYVFLDRPFVYAIIDTATGLPLFLGTVKNG